MPNWCISEITISGNSSEKINDFYSKLMDWSSKNFVENGFAGTSWLGNIAGNSGIFEWDDDCFDVRTRGSLNGIYKANDEIHLSTDTAWEPFFGMWRELLDYFVGENEWNLVFTSYEPGCAYYGTNNPDMIGKYMAEIYGSDIATGTDYSITEWAITKAELVDKLCRILNTSIRDLNKLEEIASDKGFDTCIGLWEEDSIWNHDT